MRYDKGFTVTLDEQGAELLPPDVAKIRAEIQPGKPPLYWKGFEWNWNGSHLVRGFDAVASNYSGGGVQGIGSELAVGEPNNWNAMRGDLDLLSLSAKSTSVRYYSGWVDETLLQPYLTVVPQEPPANPQPNPLDAIAKQLQTQ